MREPATKDKYARTQCSDRSTLLFHRQLAYSVVVRLVFRLALATTFVHSFGLACAIQEGTASNGARRLKVYDDISESRYFLTTQYLQSGCQVQSFRPIPYSTLKLLDYG